jgi:hypothetical protein
MIGGPFHVLFMSIEETQPYGEKESKITLTDEV